MEDLSKLSKRTPLRKTLQVQVFRRDGWLCRWCGRPVIFGPAMKYLQHFVQHELTEHFGEGAGLGPPLAYFSHNWRRDLSPLCDALGAVIDHVEPISKGGAHGLENFVTACNKCNMRKNDLVAGEFIQRHPRKPIKGKYGEPTHWDGFSTLFVVLARKDPTAMRPSEAQWLQALTAPPAEAG